MVSIFKFLFPKETKYEPKPKFNQCYKREREDFLKKKEPSTFIKGIRKNKNSERERESTHSFVGKKYRRNKENDIK